jgi:hypothetical protein
VNKTVVRTYLAAVALLAVSLLIGLYGHYLFESQRFAEKGLFTVTDACFSPLDTWEQASGFIGLMAISVAIAGTMFWDREPDPIAEQSSILRLDERAPGQMMSVAAPLKRAVVVQAHVDESNARLHEEESLTPLERVIRGY